MRLRGNYLYLVGNIFHIHKLQISSFGSVNNNNKNILPHCRRLTMQKETQLHLFSDDESINAGLQTPGAVLHEIYNKSSERNIFSLQVTGGCSQLLSWIFATPGASSSVMEACVPYSNSALLKLLQTPNLINSKACCTDTAMSMANAARIRAIELILREDKNFRVLANSNIFGVSCTAALVSTSPKKGAHRCHVGISSNNQRFVSSVILEKGLRTRIEEDYVCSRLALDALADISQIPQLPVDYLKKNTENITDDSADEITEVITKSSYSADDVFSKLETKAIKNAFFVYKSPSVPVATDPNALFKVEDYFSIHEDVVMPDRSLIYSGSFNPLHEGHVSLVGAALKASDECQDQIDVNHDSNKCPQQQPLVVFEISLLNADKPPLAREDIIGRIRQFSLQNEDLKISGLTNFAVCVTSEPFFLGKSKIFNNCDFILGIDTMTRLLNAKYYENSILSMISVMSLIKGNGVRFLVGGRTISLAKTIISSNQSLDQPLSDSIKNDLQFVTLSDFLKSSECESLPMSIKEMFTGLSENQFRVDLSSTEIRSRSK